MKLVLSACDEKMSEVAGLTMPSKVRWALKNGFDFEMVGIHHSGSHPAWEKLQLIRGRFDFGYSHVFWIDADSVITNENVDASRVFDGLEDFWIVASKDWTDEQYIHLDPAFNWSSGAMLVNKEAIPVFDYAIENFKPLFSNNPLHDQSALKQSFADNPAWLGKFRMLERRVLNSVPADIHCGKAIEPWREGDFIAHITCMENVERVKWLKRFFAMNKIDEVIP